MSTETLLKHAGYVGSVEVSIEDGCLHGKLLHIQDVIAYEGRTVAGLTAAFRDAVTRYQAHCRAIGKHPSGLTRRST